MPWKLAFRLVRALLALYGVFWTVAAIQWPIWFEAHLSFLRIEDDGLCRYLRRDEHQPKWQVWLKAVLAIAAIGVLVYSAAFAITDAIPYNWRELDEDGEDTGTTRMAIHWTIVVLASPVIAAALAAHGATRADAVHRPAMRQRYFEAVQEVANRKREASPAPVAVPQPGGDEG
jgi:hypothetical protein